MAPASDDLIANIYGAAADRARWPQVLSAISDHIGAQGAMLAQVGATNADSAFLHVRISEPHFDLFVRHHLWNPWTEAMRHVPKDRAIIMGSVVDPGRLRRSALHADVLAPQRTVDQINVELTCFEKNGGVGGMGFPFQAQGADALEEGVRKLQRLIPHLRLAFEVSCRLGCVDQDRQLDATLALLSTAAVVLDRRGCIVLANPAAELLLREDDGLVVVDGGELHLNAALPGEAAQFRLAIAMAVASSVGEDGELGPATRLSRPSGKPPLIAIPMPLPPPSFPFWTLRSARAIVLLIDPTNESLAAPETLRMAFGLTAAEARVARLIAAGHSAPATAAELGIAPTTVKTHLQRCFEKTGVRSQVQLARLLSAIPARRG